jgi:prepilin peptidase CpaA
VVFAVIMVTAAVFDLRWRRIPNAVTVGGVALGLLFRGIAGWDPLVAGALGLGLGLLFSVPFFIIGALGGGDAKLLAAVGAFMGPKDLVGACLLIAVLGGVLALVEAIRRGALRALLLNVVYMLTRLVSPLRRTLSPTLLPPARMTIPYGVPIAVGALAWWFWGGNVL